MRLKKLVLYGFKSFPTRTEIVVGEGITGIVGPNGSGKSNIGDAVRWVLGEQSPKNLRGASMSDVIFNGTQKRKPLSYCEVSLVFDNEDHALNLDFAEIMVTRRVYRSGQSDYFLNGSSCRLRDVIDLFRDTGIGKEGYSIIGQGRIDEILSRKSEDRRQVFEEAAGIVKFKVRKEEADKRLARTLDNLSRVEDILDELSRQLSPLEEQSRAARRYLELFDEMKGLDLTLFLVRSDRLQNRLKELDQELDNLRQVLADSETHLADQSLKRDACQERIAEMDGLIRQAREALMQATDLVHAQQTRAAQIENRIANRAQRRTQLAETEEAARRRMEELDRASHATQEDLTRQTEEIGQTEKALGEAKTREEKTSDALSRAENALEEHKEQIIRAMNRSSALQNDQTRLNTMRSQMEARLRELSDSRGELDADGEALDARLSETKEQLLSELKTQEDCAAAHRDAQAELERLDAEVIRVRAEAERLSTELQNTQTRWKLLDEMTREMEGYQQSVRHAVQHAREQRISGVRGVLAQLITVPREIETAVDMALGAAQQNIVTDRQETAKEIIAYLRQNRLGRATFLPMDAVRGKTLTSQERRVLSMPGCIGVASELVQCAPEYRPIVDNLLGRTVIADNLDHGIPIMNAGNHAFRLVTLTGDVMHTGGSMTGGSAQSRMVNLLSRERELKELTQRLREGKVTFDNLKQKLIDAQQRKDQQKTAVAEALDALHQQEIAVAREQEHMERATAELEAHRERVSQLTMAQEQLSEQMKDISAQLEELNRTGGDARFDEAAAEQETERLQQEVLKARIAAQHATDDVMRLTLSASDARHALEMLQLDNSHREQERQTLLAERALRERQLGDMAREDEQDQELMKQAGAELEQLQVAQGVRQRELDQQEDKRSGEQRRLAELLRAIDELHAAHDRDSEAQHRAELARSRADSDLHSLQERIWNTYELTYAGAEPFRIAEGFKERDADRRVKELSTEIKGLGSINLNAMEEYAATKARFDELTTQQQDLKTAEKDLRELIERLLEEMRVTFTEHFSKLQVYFSETFTRLFGGGHADLMLMDEDDPLNCGIEINAQPPGKKLQLLSLLSGGERALTAIAILFAMLKLKPTPFCILDEIEAALDDANIGYYADYLKEYSTDTQFIVITHRKGTMERCNALYGVSMEEQGVSKMVSVSLQDWKEDAE